MKKILAIIKKTRYITLQREMFAHLPFECKLLNCVHGESLNKEKPFRSKSDNLDCSWKIARHYI